MILLLAVVLNLYLSFLKQAKSIWFYLRIQEGVFTDNEDLLIENRDKEKIFRDLLALNIKNSACLSIIKKEILIQNSITFPVGRTFEDLFTIYKIIYNCENVIKIKNVIYHYNVSENSISSEFNKQNIDDIFSL